MRRQVFLAAVMLGSATMAEAGTLPDAISSDGFESGNTLGWDLTVPTLESAVVFRMSDLDLRDPHVFTNIPGLPVFGCLDFTDNGFPLGLAPSFNAQLATSITTDGDGDGWLDLSQLLAFRPLLFFSEPRRLDTGGGWCSPPTGEVLICSAWRRPPVPLTTTYSFLDSGTCLAPVAGTTSGYSPAVPAPTAQALCYFSTPRDFVLDVNGVQVTLIDTQSGATWDAVEGRFSPGLLRGFLTEAVANATLIPAEIPVVGGRPLSSLLRGGMGSCATGDDRDTHLGQPGWWFYFAFEADAIGFPGA
ncbi:MAG: hypothetical protein SF066_15625 [Thermoanaerobaculia bacterium]|nr:hypothetical protein [Thermoanaerobaculia bacterium]